MTLLRVNSYQLNVLEKSQKITILKHPTVTDDKYHIETEFDMCYLCECKRGTVKTCCVDIFICSCCAHNMNKYSKKIKGHRAFSDQR